MTTTEALQLGVAALFPLALIALLVAVAAAGHGRTNRQIALGLGGIVACLGGVIVTGLTLRALRGGPLFDYVRGSFHFGSISAADVIGVLICAALLLFALRLSRRLMSGAEDATERRPE